MKEYTDIDGVVWTEKEIENGYAEYLEDWEHEFSYSPKLSYEEYKEEFLTI